MITRRNPSVSVACVLLLSSLALSGCGVFGSESEAADATGGRPAGGRGTGGFGAPGAGGPTTAIPIEVVPVTRRGISQFLETNGTLQAEKDVDLVARTSGPIVELNAEEGMAVVEGALLARIDADEIRARLRIAKVALADAELRHERARAQYDSEILSRELFDQAVSELEAAQAALHETEVQLAYTDIRAPFAGLIAVRHIKLAQHVQVGMPLFRISDFDPLECPIQVPEKDLASIQVGQPAYLTVEAYGDERFRSRVQRVSPVVDSATGTVKVTLEVSARGRLRPGMFASVFLETDRHENALVIPKAALVLESIGDTVYVRAGDVAQRREVRLAYDEGDFVEVVEGLAEGDEVIVLGQDSLADGTPVYVLDDAAGGGDARGSGALPGAGAGGDFGPERLEGMKQRMKERGLTDAQIEERIEQMKSGQLRPGAGGGGPGSGPTGGGRGPGP